MTGAVLRISEDKSLELRYTARRAERLEEELGTGLLAGLGQTNRVGTLIKYIAHGAGISADEARDAYDEYIEGGGSMATALDAIVAALKNGGFISSKAVEAAKKLQEKLEDRTAPRS